MTTLDARAPLVFDTRALRRRAGVMEDVSCTVTLGQDVGTDVIAIPAGEPIDLDVRLESVVEGVLASGTVRSIASAISRVGLTRVAPWVRSRSPLAPSTEPVKRPRSGGRRRASSSRR